MSRRSSPTAGTNQQPHDAPTNAISQHIHNAADDDDAATADSHNKQAAAMASTAFPTFVENRGGSVTTTGTAAANVPTTQSNHPVKTKLRKKRSDAPRTASNSGPGGGSHSSSATAGSSNSGTNSTRRRQQGGHQGGLADQQQQSIYRRLARARWAAAMFLPPLLLLLHRTDRVEVETNGLLHTIQLLGVFGCLGTVAAVNELLGTRGSHKVAYACVFSFSLLWGGVIVAIRDLTAARFLTMLWFGICCGSLRYHWGDHIQPQAAASSSNSNSVVHHGRSNSSRSLHALPPLPSTTSFNQNSNGGIGQASPPPAAKAQQQHQQQQSDAQSSESTTTTGRPVSTRPQPLQNYVSQSEKSVVDDTSPMLSSEGQQKHRSRGNRLQSDTATTAAEGKSNSTNPDDDGEDDEEQADYFFLLSQQQRGRWNRWGYMWSRSVEYLRFTVWRKTSLCLCASLAEVVACAVFVPNSWSDIIALSWVGYLAMLILPVVIFKSASWVSHALILVCGSRVNTADASRMLFCYWLTTTVLSLGTLLITMFWIVTSLVPYVWGLQVLMMPYAVACEWIALESREYQATNPYKEIAEVYREHIDTTMQNSKEYFLH